MYDDCTALHLALSAESAHTPLLMMDSDPSNLDYQWPQLVNYQAGKLQGCYSAQLSEQVGGGGTSWIEVRQQK